MAEKNTLDERLLAGMLQDFIEEAREHIKSLEITLAGLEKEPENQELMEEVFRLTHTIKGTSSFVEMKKVTRLAHRMEDLLVMIRKGSLTISPEIIDLLLEGTGLLWELIRETIKNGPTGQEKVKTEEFTSKITSVLACKKKARISLKKKASFPETTNDPLSTSIRVPVKRVNSIMNLSGELITASHRLKDCARRLNDPELTGASEAVERIAGRLVDDVSAMRMVPVRTLFMKFPILVRNLARRTKKSVNLEISGGETGMDREMVQHLHDPLVQLIRNAVDHGIEHPGARKKAGKPETGTIRLISSRKGGRLRIEVEDDGRGIDPEDIKDIAVKKGIISRRRAREISGKEALRLIFMPGLTTTEGESGVSGRGVGMDLVHQQVRRIRGTIDIETIPEKGTTFKITLPASLFTMDLLLLEAGDRSYGIPVDSVIKTARIGRDDVKRLGNRKVIILDGDTVSFLYLAELLGIDGGPEKDPGMIPVVIIKTRGKKTALGIHRLLGIEEFAIRPLGSYPGRIAGVEGATILGDGSVVPVLDLEEIMILRGGQDEVCETAEYQP